MDKLKLTYRVLQVLFGLAMLGAAAAKLTQQPMLVESFTRLGYPMYLLMILSIAYVLGVIAMFQPWSTLLQEWAYTGFTIALVGAFSSHLLAGDAFDNAVPAAVLLVLLLGVYGLRKRLMRKEW
ncbi:DoxX family protein [Thiothrix lacustris]|uniref:DoxX family protein n=1 Tax=Thiothrix lacustris TaxID=525917 RepID=UPI0027E4D3A4|nr:DoxX family protein [Thiothrix lacustris]WMP19423.1 DoxX family protein [Thiothrix lacustris]